MAVALVLFDFSYTSGATLTAKVFASGAIDAGEVYTAAAVAEYQDGSSNPTGRYYATVATVDEGDYQMVVYSSNVGVLSNLHYTVSADSSVEIPWSEYKPLTQSPTTSEIVAAIQLANIIWQPGQENSAQIIRLRRNDSYDGVGNPVLSFPSDQDYTSGFTGLFRVAHRLTGALMIEKAVTVASASSVTVTLAASETTFTDITSDADFGPHPFEIEMTSGTSKQTKWSGACIVSRDLG